jgi:hypothetical protein
MAVRKCPKCGSVWYTDLTKCAFCGVDGEEVKGPISPAKLNISHGGVSAAPKSGGEESSVVVKPDEERTPAAAVAVEKPPPPPPPPPPVVQAPPPMPEPPPKLEPAPEPVRRPERTPALRPVAKAEPVATAAAPQIPSATVPLVFGALGVVACFLLPAIGPLSSDRVLVILSLLAWSILAPFAPFAWFTGQRYLDQCRALGFVPASSAATGMTLGKVATFLIVFEFSALSIFVAVQSLSGKLVCPLWK